MRSLHMTRAVAAELIDACRRAYPLEACGFLAGAGDVARSRYALKNVDEQPRQRFLAHPRDQIEAFDQMRANGEELVAIYPSPPETPAVPSLSDIKESVYPHIFHVIVGLMRPEHPEVRAFLLHPERGCSAEVRLHVYG